MHLFPGSHPIVSDCGTPNLLMGKEAAVFLCYSISRNCPCVCWVWRVKSNYVFSPGAEINLFSRFQQIFNCKSALRWGGVDAEFLRCEDGCFVSVFICGSRALSSPRSPFLLNQIFRSSLSLIPPSLFPPLVTLYHFSFSSSSSCCFSLHNPFLLSPSFLGHCRCSHGNHRIHVCLIHMRSINSPAGWR